MPTLEKITRRSHEERQARRKSIYFLNEDLIDFDQRIAEAKSRVEAAGQQIGVAVSGGGETWHDNFAHEQATRDHGMWSRQLNELSAIRSSAKVVEPDYLAGYVGLGRTAILQDESDGSTVSIRIGSYRVYKPGSVSYCSPVAKAILGAEIGELKTLQLNEETRTYRVIGVT